MSKKSWVWKHASQKANKTYCNLCDDNNNEFSCPGGTTGSIGRHLKVVHNITPPISTSLAELSEITLESSMKEADSVDENLNITLALEQKSSKSRKRRHHREKRSCSPNRTEEIHQALAKMVAINQLPLSFCLSEGFKQFMAIVQPDYAVCKEDALKRRLLVLRDTVKEKIKDEFNKAPAIACTSDC